MLLLRRYLATERDWIELDVSTGLFENRRLDEMLACRLRRNCVLPYARHQPYMTHLANQSRPPHERHRRLSQEHHEQLRNLHMSMRRRRTERCTFATCPNE